MFGFPPKYCRPLATRVNGDDAYVLLNTGSSAQPYLYGVSCHRRNGRWFEGGSSNMGGGFESDESAIGTLSVWDEAPVGADMVRIEFDGQIFEEPVVERGYLMVWWSVPEPRIWPYASAFRINGRWTRPDFRRASLDT